MMSDKHTPGPWSHDADHEQTWHPKIKTDPEVFAGTICEVLSNLNIAASDHRMFDEMKANARLIAAAPDLLEALESSVESAGIIRSLIESIEAHGNYSAESTINFLNQALGCHYLSPAAIAKAKGEQKC